MASDTAIGRLAPFSVAAGGEKSRGRAPSIAWSRGKPVYVGPGWVGGRLLRVESRREPRGYLLRIERAGDFAVSADGGLIRGGRTEPGSSPSPGDEVVSAVLGPCLALALALRGIWCFHASAAGTERSAVALIGDSGAGKSTLAAALAAQSADWLRIGDDVLPVRLQGHAASALPRFPQPGLEPRLQWRPPAPAAVDLAAVFVLEPGGGDVEVRPLSRRDAVLALVRQTVAARLFDADLQARHLEVCAELAQELPVRELRFPRRPAALPSMTAAIAGAVPV